MHREEYDLDLRMHFLDLPHGFYAVEHRHGNVGNDDIGPELFRSGYEFTTVLDDPGDVKVGV